MKFYATLSPGLEEIAKEDVINLGGKILEVREGKGRIFFKGKEELIAKTNYLSRTLERINILLHREKVENLEDIYKIIYNIDWSFIDENQSFAIRPLRVGVHNFTSIDIGRVAGEALIKSYQKDKNVRLKVNLDNPDVIVRVELIFNELLVGLDTTGDVALDKRGWRVFNHPAHLNATIAASLVYFSNFKDDETLLDVMCGSGTIPIEAALLKRNIPPGIFREKKYSFQFLKLFGYNLLNKIKENISMNNNIYNIYGFDKNPKFIDGAKENANNANVLDTINFDVGDAEHFNMKFDIIITNPPYGIRMGRKKYIKKLYENFLSSAKKNMHGDARIIVITAETKLFKDAIYKNNLEIKKNFKVMFGGLLTEVFYLTL
ncbi:tRNA (guanine(6)-N2)-methyltransferase [Methanocaldococcus indicus]|uniref:tRNA (guanine(6)-N2)-methyltransferase n=1 Tax=Methanocaldococcus indicus TaxID=213231 RepID=UPI003C6D8175